MRPSETHRILQPNSKLSKEEAMREPASKTNADSSPRTITQLVAGAALVLGGVVVFLANLDLLDLGRVWRYWPLVLIGVGVNKLIRPAEKKSKDEGVWLCMIGAWLLISNLKLFGLGFGKSWPLLILAIGISIVWSSLTTEAPANTPAEEKNGR
jgi:LiaF transmembrane domain